MLPVKRVETSCSTRLPTEARGLARRVMERMNKVGTCADAIVDLLADAGPAPKPPTFKKMIERVERTLGEAHVLTLNGVREQGRKHSVGFHYVYGKRLMGFACFKRQSGEILAVHDDGEQVLTIDEMAFISGRSGRLIAAVEPRVWLSFHALARYAERGAWKASDDEAFMNAVRVIMPVLTRKAERINQLLERLIRSSAVANALPIILLDGKGGAWLEIARKPPVG